MSLSGIQIRAPEDSDIPAILNLLRRSLGKGEIPWSQDYWRWKHQENPFGPSPVRVAEADGQIVGVRVFMQCLLCVGSRYLSCARPVDTATHPDWQRRGIFSELTRSMLNHQKMGGVSLIFNTPNAQSRPANLGLGWTEVGRIRFATKLVRPFRVIRGRLIVTEDSQDVQGSSEVGRLQLLNGGRKGVAPARNFLRVKDVHTLIKDGSRPSEGRLTIPVSLDYLLWRYVDIPTIDYFVSWDDDLRAAVIFRITQKRSLTGVRICELLFDDCWMGFSTMKNVITKVINLVEPDYLLTTTSGVGSCRSMLYRMGFIPVPGSGRTLVARQLADDGLEGLDPYEVGSWGLSFGSLEVI